jgi:hypothetical protein
MDDFKVGFKFIYCSDRFMSSRMIASVRWPPVTSPTATRGIIMPPTLPTALATPTPVVLTAVGYN